MLTDASVHGKTDTLEGLKENVIVGRLHPGGHGLLPARPAAHRRQARRGPVRPSREQAMEPLPDEIAAEEAPAHRRASSRLELRAARERIPGPLLAYWSGLYRCSRIRAYQRARNRAGRLG